MDLYLQHNWFGKNHKTDDRLSDAIPKIQPLPKGMSASY